MLELAMATALRHDSPPILLDFTENVTHFHLPGWPSVYARARRKARRLCRALVFLVTRS
jgi:hypothetical protein